MKCAVQHGRIGLKVTWLSLMKASSDAQELQREASLRSPLESCGLDGRVCEEAAVAHMAVIFLPRRRLVHIGRGAASELSQLRCF